MKTDTTQTAGFSFAGKRVSNQDSIFFKELDDRRQLLIIADGMGGEIGGEVASSLAIDSVYKTLLSRPSAPLTEVFSEVQKQFIKKTEQNTELSKMGTTLTVCVLNEYSVDFAHVGDTRLYHLRGNGLVTKTKDQTELQRLLDEGVLSKARVRRYNRKNILLSVMSAGRDYELQTGTFDVESGDRLLLLSDGVYSLIKKREIVEVSKLNPALDCFVEGIRSIIESREIRDDCSVLSCEIS